MSAHFQNVEMRRGRKLTSYPIWQGSCIYLRLSLCGGSDHIDQPLPGTSDKPGLTESQRVGTTTAYSRATRHRLSSETLVRGTPYTTAGTYRNSSQQGVNGFHTVQSPRALGPPLRARITGYLSQLEVHSQYFMFRWSPRPASLLEPTLVTGRSSM